MVYGYGTGDRGDARAQLKAAKAYAKAQRPWYKKKRFILPIIFGAFVLAGVAASGGGSSGGAAAPAVASKPAALVPPIVVNAKVFGDEFDANQVAAERKYAGKRIRLTAEVTNITDGALSFGEVTSKISLTQVHCELVDPDQAVSVKNGQQVTVVGTVDDQSMGVISLKECAVVG